MLSQELAVKVLSFLHPHFTACNREMTWNMMRTYLPVSKTKGNKIIYFNCSKKTKQLQEHTGCLSSSMTAWPYSSDTRSTCPFKNHFDPPVHKGLKHLSVILLVNEEHHNQISQIMEVTLTPQDVINWSINSNFRLLLRNCFKITLFSQRFPSFHCNINNLLQFKHHKHAQHHSHSLRVCFFNYPSEDE